MKCRFVHTTTVALRHYQTTISIFIYFNMVRIPPEKKNHKNVSLIIQFIFWQNFFSARKAPLVKFLTKVLNLTKNSGKNKAIFGFYTQQCHYNIRFDYLKGTCQILFKHTQIFEHRQLFFPKRHRLYIVFRGSCSFIYKLIDDPSYACTYTASPDVVIQIYVRHMYKYECNMYV